MMRKFISLTLSLFMILGLLTACRVGNGSPTTSTSEPQTSKPETSETEDAGTNDDYTLRIGTMKGPTGMGMAKLIADNNTSNKYTVELFGAPEDITAKLISGNLDIAAVPVNLAAIINKRTDGAYLVAAINTLGVLHIVENGETIQSIADLEGKTLYATGQGSTPEYMLNYILEANGLTDKVTIEWKTEHSELSTLLASGVVTLAMLPEPHVTTALSKKDTLRVALDLTTEWDKVSNGDAVQGCIVVSKKAIEKHKDLVDAFLDEYKISVDYVNDNIPEASQIIADLGIVGAAAVAERAIPRCNIVYIDGDSMVDSLTAFYTVLYNANPQSIGGTMPDATLYYKK